jgi:uncharacterized protein YdhG (YjbR/CyaY superfamily)
MKPETIDDYIASFPADIQKVLKKIRTTIRKAIPDAEEAIKYQMPTYVLNGNVVSFGAYKTHIGLYPTPATLGGFDDELARYRAEKSTLRFPLDEPMPLELIAAAVTSLAARHREQPAKKKR